jgi:hypothetical protein
LQEWTNALGPGGFVVLSAFDALVVKVLAHLPPILQEEVAKLFDIVNDARAFLCTDVEPNARAGLDGRTRCEAMNYALIPPNGRRERCETAKDMWMFESEIQRDQSAQGGAAHSRHARIGNHAVLLLNKGHHLLHEEFRVAVGAATAETRRFGGRVFVDANFAHVVNSNDDERLYGACKNEIVAPSKRFWPSCK